MPQSFYPIESSWCHQNMKQELLQILTNEMGMPAEAMEKFLTQLFQDQGINIDQANLDEVRQVTANAFLQMLLDQQPAASE